MKSTGKKKKVKKDIVYSQGRTNRNDIDYVSNIQVTEISNSYLHDHRRHQRMKWKHPNQVMQHAKETNNNNNN